MRLLIPGAAGRMGRMLVRTIAESGDLRLGAAMEHAGHSLLGRDAGEVAEVSPNGVAITADLATALAAADVVIDFTAPDATVNHLDQYVAAQKPIVIGTTGFSAEQRAAVVRAAERLPILLSANMSLGVNLLAELVAQAARALPAHYDAEIVELHHRLKKDSPSGTAVLLGDALARARETTLDAVAKHGREGLVGARPTGEIGMHAVRGGDVVGDHTVYFLGPGERLELSHRASTRQTFALGALAAARWMHQRPAGLYSMKDVLGL